MSFFANIIDVGANPLNNNLHLYRQFKKPEFQLAFLDSNLEEIDPDNSYIKINYLWWYEDTNGDPIYPGKIEYYYLVADVPGHPNFSNRLDELWDSPIDGSAPGLRNAIEAVLAALPFNVPQGYTLNTPI